MLTQSDPFVAGAHQDGQIFHADARRGPGEQAPMGHAGTKEEDTENSQRDGRVMSNLVTELSQVRDI